jgi:hypothetical protein
VSEGNHPAGYHYCERELRATKSAVDADNQRAAAWHDRQSALLLLHDKGVDLDDAKLSAMGAELARDRQWGHDTWQNASRYRRMVVATLIEAEDAIDNGVEPAKVLPLLLKALGKLSEKHKAEL